MLRRLAYAVLLLGSGCALGDLDLVELTVDVSGRGQGKIQSGDRIDCGTDCEELYPRGFTARLDAVPAPGSRFAGWNGACRGLGTCEVKMDQDAHAGATFDLAAAELTVTRAGDGTGTVTSTPAGIDCGATCKSSFAFDTRVTLMATPAFGSLFRGFSGACDGPSCSVDVTASLSVVARFEAVPTLVVSRAGRGTGTIRSNPAGIDCGTRCAISAERGARYDLAAIPDATSELVSWTGACTGTGPCSLTLDRALTATATFELKRFSLEVTLAGGGFGTVTSTPAGIVCGVSCSESFEIGTVVRLSPTPEPGFFFMGWSGDCTGTGACTVTMSGARRVTATFAERIFTLTVSTMSTAGGSGLVRSSPLGIDCGQLCRGMFRAGTRVTLTPVPGASSTLTAWSGDCTGSGACEVVVDRNRTVRATFGPLLHRLDVRLSGSGRGTVSSSPSGISCGADCTETFRDGTRVTLTAMPETGSVFRGWSGGGCSGTGACTVDMSAPAGVTATFDARFPLLLTLTGNGRGTVTSTPAGVSCPGDCNEIYFAGTMVTLTATAAEGSSFSGWSGACTGITPTCRLTLNAAASASAGFAVIVVPPVRPILAVSIEGAGAGTVGSSSPGIACGSDCSETYSGGETVTLTASPSPGSRFAGWLGPCTGTASCTVTMSVSKTVSAVFESRYQFLPAGPSRIGSPDAEPGRRADEGPVHEVVISRVLWIKATEVTLAEWRNVMGGTSGVSGACESCPVEEVGFDEAAAFTNALSAREGLELCHPEIAPGTYGSASLDCSGYRLPAEAEWEHAARAGSSTAFSGGAITNASDDCGADPVLDASGWFCGNSQSRAQPVASKAPNAFGLHDVHGGVAEWTNDFYDAAFYATGSGVDPAGPSTGSFRVLRGGSYRDFPRATRSAARSAVPAVAGGPGVGLRPVRSTFVHVPPGTFTMGSPGGELGRRADEDPPHPVTISRALLVRGVEVTAAEWRALSASPPTRFASCGATCPAENVSWDDASLYLDTRSFQGGRSPCYLQPGLQFAGLSCDGYRHPTEAEWEYFARAGSTSAFWSGPITDEACNDAGLRAVAWYCGSASGRIQRVAGLFANPFGLFDVHGNAREWTNDRYDAGFYRVSPARDPLGPASGAQRVYRGGSFADDARVVRSAARAFTATTAGVRPVRALCGAAGLTQLPSAGAPLPRRLAQGVWTGSEVLLFGGYSDARADALDDGGRYDPVANAWSALPAGGPTKRVGHGVAWTGREMLVFGGGPSIGAPGGLLGDGARLDPRSGAWRRIAQNARTPGPRQDFAHAWTGREWLIFGGSLGTRVTATAARYVPGADDWLPVARSSLTARSHAAAVWTGSRVLVAGGRGAGGQLAADFSLYDPIADSWTASTSIGGCAGASRAVIAGGYVVLASETGWCRYDLRTSRWSPIAPRPAARVLAGGTDAILASTGAEVLVFGGSARPTDGVLDAYDPAGDTWRQPLASSPNLERAGTQAVWTGCAMQVFSGQGASNPGYLFTP